MANTARIDELKKKFDENPRRYFAPLANEFRKSGDIEQAIIICEEFLPQQPGHMSGHIVYGQALYEVSRFPEARTVFETALGLDPENLIALRHLGDIAKGEGDVGGARSWYLRVLDADPRNDEIQSLIDALGGGAQTTPPVAPTPSFLAEAPPPQAPAPEPEALSASSYQEPEPEPIDLDSSLIDTLPAGMPAVVTTPATGLQSAGEGDLLSGFSTHGFEVENTEFQPDAGMAEGLESTAFVAPVDERIESLDLDDSLGSGVPEFVPPANVSAVPGLQGSGAIAHERLPQSAPPRVDLESFDVDALVIDDGATAAPHGDPVSSTAPTPVIAHAAMYAPAPASSELLDFDIAEEPDAVTLAPSTTDWSEPAADTIPVELPPEVIAAEAEILEFEEDLAPPSDSATPFVTETMAELYLAQGFRDEARGVYEQLAQANPYDERFQALLAELSTVYQEADRGPSARDFFARIAARRPRAGISATTPPATGDFALGAADKTAESDSATVDPLPVPAGSIDALFGNSPAAASEDTAAAALAHAFGTATPTDPLIVGNPAREASDELSLDSVFRDAPARAARTSQSFSFDQFFAGGGSSPSAPPRNSSATPADTSSAERSADDIEQFNSWLQGLKPQ